MESAKVSPLACFAHAAAHVVAEVAFGTSFDDPLSRTSHAVPVPSARAQPNPTAHSPARSVCSGELCDPRLRDVTAASCCFGAVWRASPDPKTSASIAPSPRAQLPAAPSRYCSRPLFQCLAWLTLRARMLVRLFAWIFARPSRAALNTIPSRTRAPTAVKRTHLMRSVAHPHHLLHGTLACGRLH